MVRAAVVLAVAGVVVLVAGGGGTATTAVAIGLFGIAGVLGMSAVFYAIGRSEDEARRRGE